MPARSDIITSRTNPRLKQLRAAFAGNARLAGDLIAIEGETLLREAVRSGVTLVTVFLNTHHPLPEWLPKSVDILRVADELLASAADTQAPKGIAALLTPPHWEFDDVLRTASSARTLLLVADSLQDPGNLGTLIRSAEAFGASAVFTTPGTVSPWNQKALRASAGSAFRIPVIATDNSGLQRLKSAGVRLLAAVSSGRSAIPASAIDLVDSCAWMIGNEGSGLSADLLALADAHATLPTPGPVESLNAAVAGSLLLYEASRQRASAQHADAR